MDFKFKTIHEFNDHFKDEETCYRFFEQQRWEDGKPICPHCGSVKAPYNVKARGKFQDIPSYRCSERECKLPFTVRTGSIFEGSKVELRKWFQAAYELTTSKKGISSVELGERIGVSQKTAWFINHRIRTMLFDVAPEMLEGVVEVDETYVGGKNKNRHKDKKVEGSQGRSHKDKTPVVGMVKRGGNLVTKVVGDVKSKTLTPIVEKNVSPDSLVYTDEWKGYNGVSKVYDHEIVKHNEGQYVNGLVHTNTVEGFWSLLKRGITGIYHYVSPQHLHRYCAEFQARYNERGDTNIQRFVEIVQKSDKNRVRYAELTATKPVPIIPNPTPAVPQVNLKGQMKIDFTENRKGAMGGGEAPQGYETELPF